MKNVLGALLLLLVLATVAGCPVDDVVARRRCDDASPCADAH